MKHIIIASNNKHKLKEINTILDNYKLLTLNDIGFYDDIIEDGETFEENALIKATTIRKYIEGTEYSQYPIIADDSGLSVDALNSAPGIFSARYSGQGDEGNRQKLLKELEGVTDRKAHFYCCMAISLPNGETTTRLGKTEGTITTEKIGDESFGYDCLFMSTPLNKTFGEATEEEKNSVSHRYYALLEVKKFLAEIEY
ncbi:MAG: RdgB/HAM1 family non-canonical purine NTP pyrophosphatase [Clostridiales bacterium]|nr:RdgB/HAM1 family non-canonical purine NTP pyrophosphatase [Clostridiales bacterium]